MAVRASMQTELIPRVRQMIGDVATPQDFTDQDVQDVLDEYRDTVRYELLTPAPDIQPGQGAVTTAAFVYASYFSEYDQWEADEVLQGINTATSKPWDILTPVTSERILGKWTFAVVLPSIATPPAQYPPVYATGKTYDIYAAAAALLDRRIGLRSLTVFDFTADGRQMRLGQILDRWEKLAASYRMRARTRVVELKRADMVDARPTLIGTGQPAGLLPSVLGTNVSRTSGSGGY